ncbi:MAG: hypothetical protein ACI9D5_000597 [Candidatus Endobugula sp.]|jgi:hypothetical protein
MLNDKPSPATTAASKRSASDSRIAIWQKKLPQNPLPINNTIANKILHLLKDDSCSSTKLANIIKQDPILCLKLFHCTEKRLKEKQGEIQHIIHLIGLIGLNKIEEVVSNAKKRTQHQAGFQEILSASLFAAHLASSLLNKKHNATSDRFFLPTLFFNSPLWLMWIAAPKIMSQGQELASRKQQSYVALSAKKLGFRLPDLLAKANCFIHLPELTLQALAINPTKNIHFWAKARRLNEKKFTLWLEQDKPSRLLFYSPEMGVYLLNQYVIAIYLDWNGKHIQRYSQLLCRHLGIDDVALNAQVIELALSINLPTSFQGLLAPINRVRSLHREKNPVEEANSSPKNTVTPSSSSDALKQWLAKIKGSDNIETALELTLETLAHSVGVDHCVILHVDDNDIHTQSCYGFTSGSAINSFNHGRGQKKDLFNILLQKPACLSLSSKDLVKAAKTIPQDFTDHCSLKPCGLLSVFYQDKPKAIIYCDHNQWDQQKHRDFKMVGKYLAHTLRQL